MYRPGPRKQSFKLLSLILIINKSWSLLFQQQIMKRSPVLRKASQLSLSKSSKSNSNINGSSSRKDDDAFYKKIGEPKYITAPMVAQSDLAFRLLTRKFGADLCYTQMLHAANFVKSADFRKNHLDVYPPGTVVQAVPSQLEALGRSIKDKYYIEYGAEADEGPVMIQMAGNDGDVVKEAALRILDQIYKDDSNSNVLAGIDVNLGCPQGIARKGNYGAHLFTNDCDGTQVCRILSSLNEVLPEDIGLSAKIRLLPNLDELPNRIQMMLDHARLDLLTIHGRTIKENKTKTRDANWDAIAQITNTFPHLPIIANGGIEYTSDLQRCLSHTNAHAVMSSEALLENPGLFQQKGDDADLTPREILYRQINYALTYLQLTLKYPPLPVTLGKGGGSFSVIRSHLFKMLYRYLQEHPDIRNLLGDHRLVHTIPQAIDLVHTLSQRYDTVSDDELDMKVCSNLDSSWYRRHRILDGRFIHVRNDDNSNQSMSQTNGAMEHVKIQNNSITMEEKKELMRQRIMKLKGLNGQKQSVTAKSTNFI